jgi:hypothetical protein
LVAVEGDRMSFGGESVGVVAERVLDRAEDLFGRHVGEGLGHLACALFQERLEPLHEALDPGLAVFDRCRHAAVGVCHDWLTGGDLLHRR